MIHRRRESVSERRDHAMWLRMLTLGCAVAGSSAVESVRIDRCTVDGHPVPASGTQRPPAAASAEVGFAFTADPPTRLQYRLDGYDHAWRDLAYDMRLSLKLRAADGSEVRSLDILMRGCSPGWRGAVANSDFTERTQEFTAPPVPCSLEALLFSGGPPEVCGVLWMTGLRLDPLGTGPEPVEVHELIPPPAAGATPGAVGGWERDGSDSAMTTAGWVLGRWSIGLRDGDADRFATWRTDRRAWVPLAPGARYRLTWQELYSIGGAGPGRVRYPSLPPGTYRFHVGTASLEGLPTGVETTLDLELPEPIWRRWWFRAVIGPLLVVPLFAAWFAIARSRMRVAVQRAEGERALVHERARIAQDLHDDLGANLTQIALLSELAQRRLDPGHQARHLMDDIFRTAEGLARQLDEAVWAVNPSHDTLEGLAAFLAKYVQDFLAPAGIRCRLLIPDELPALALTGIQRHNLVMAAKEVLHNIVQHAGAHLVTMAISAQGGRVSLEFRDDGRGIPDAAAGPGADGLANLRARMERLAGACAMRSGPEGTTVTLTVDVGREGRG